MINKLEGQNTILSTELVTSLTRRIKERQTSMTAVLLENSTKYPEQDRVSTNRSRRFAR